MKTSPKILQRTHITDQAKLHTSRLTIKGR